MHASVACSALRYQEGLFSALIKSGSVPNPYASPQVLTFVGETRVLVINASDELEEDELAGFDADTQTLFCGNVAGDQVVQVTRGGVRLAGAGGRGLLAEWRPPPGLQVNVASASATQVGCRSPHPLRLQ